jgi:ATP-dependent exoDNAse (exonuclease V) beta subunit
LYVALTRARDALFMFSVDNPRSENSIAGVLKNAVTFVPEPSDSQNLILKSYYNDDNKIFEFGTIPENKYKITERKQLIASEYAVSQSMESLKLKLHGENYFSSESQALRKKLNYGKLMHEIFEGINTASDIPAAIRKLVLDGKLAEEESPVIEKRVRETISQQRVADWFLPDNKVLTEAGILLPSGITKRPDRVIFKNGKTTIIDFKFGEENAHYAEQVDQYRSLLIDMGYSDIDGFIWYVDKNKIVTV